MKPFIHIHIKIIFITLIFFTAPLFPQVTISFLGDCTIGNDMRSTVFDEYVAKYGYSYFFSKVKNILAADDYTVANLETAIIDAGRPVEKQFRFRGKPEYLNILKEGSVECVTIANNHSHDYGNDGFAKTRMNLDKYKIDYFGYDKYLIKNIKGLRFAFIGNCFHVNEDMLSYIKEIRDSVDFIIVVMHWGKEKEYKPNAQQKMMAHELIDAGADLVVGHHPHVLQPVETYKGKYIAYSLGNFVFGGNTNPRYKKTMIFQAFFVKGEPVTIKQIPCSISSDPTTNDFCPVTIEE